MTAPPFTFTGPWFSSREAAAYIPCRTVNAWFKWRQRHGIVARSNGSVAKADLDRALKGRSRRGRHGHPHSLANLKHATPVEQTT